MVALALVLGMSIAATPVLAQVHDVEVLLDDYEVGAVAEYTITFNITRSLNGAKFYIEFPLGTVVPPAYDHGDVTVQPEGAGVEEIGSGDIIVDGLEVEINTILSIKAPAQVTVVFKASAGIENPSNAGPYTLGVWTNEETAGSGEYDIVLPDKSTYEFVCEFQFEDPAKIIWVDKNIGVEVTLQTEVVGESGYVGVQKQIRLGAAPTEGAVDVKIGAFEQTLTAAWVDWGATFDITNVHHSDWTGTMRFNRVGEYDVEFRLLHGANLVGDGAVTAVVAGVSYDIELNEGWNLISLPLIPESDAIETVLAGIMDDVISVWYYDAAAKDWQTFTPDAPGDLDTIEDGKAYWIRMDATATLTAVGTAIALPGEMPRAYRVEEGWNMVGFQSTRDTIKAEEYLKETSFVRIYKFEDGNWDIVEPALDNMQPGLGYWVAFSEPGTIYP